MRSGMARLAVLCAFAVSPGSVTSAQRTPVLHEFVPDVDPDEATRARGEARRDGPSVGAAEAAVAGTSQPEAPPPMIAAPGDGALGEAPGRRSPTFAPDRMTALEASLDYYATFTPSIAPFKRVTSLDAVVLAEDGRTPLLVVHDARRTRLPVEGVDAAAPDARPRDRFRGEVELDFSAGSVVPIPSVSPESRILSVHVDPVVELRLERDAAGNHFAVRTGSGPAGPVSLEYVTDAPRAYFGIEVPRVPVATLAAEVRGLPPSIRERALRFAAELGVSSASDLRSALHALVGHFRAFEESVEPPQDSGDIYLDLARGKKGICRHRAYAFVVTALALGIPARFVQNEAHSWAEVKQPVSGWMRIDLGGAAQGLTAHATTDRPPYQAAQLDGLPRPPAYERSYSQLAGEARESLRPAAEQAQGHWVEPASPQASNASAFLHEHGRPSSLLVAPAAGGRRTLRVTVDQRHSDVLRGRKLSVSGRIEAPGRGGVNGLRVEVSLAAEGRKDRMLLGVTLTDEGGYFRGAFGVPSDLEVGDYRLVVVTPGDGEHLPAMAE